MNRSQIKTYFFDLLMGSLSGFFLVLAYGPYNLYLLALMSSVLFLFWIIYHLDREQKAHQVFLFLFMYLVISRAFFFVDNYSLLVNKMIFKSWQYPLIFFLMTSQIIILPLILGSISITCIHLNRHRLNLYMRLFLIGLIPLLLDLLSFWNLPITPLIPLVKMMPFNGVVSFWGHWGLSFFYFLFLVLLINLIYQEKKIHWFCIPLLIICFYCAPLIGSYFTPHGEPQKITVITINQTFNIVSNENDFSPNLEQYLKDVAELYRKEIDTKNVIFLWNESAFVQLPGNSKKINQVISSIKLYLPGHHFIGIFPLEINSKNELTGTPTYSYVNSFNNSHQTYFKKFLVPLDENLDYFPWLPMSKFIKPIIVQKIQSPSFFQVGKIKVGVLLCNEIAETIKLESSGFFKGIDLVISPSNVPQMFKNHFESSLNDYAYWVHFLTDKPVIRSSNSNLVTLFTAGEKKTISPSNFNTHKIILELP